MADTTTNRAPKFVRVACKLPHGLWLELHNPPPPFDPLRPSFHAVTAAVRPRVSIKLNGANSVKNHWNTGFYRVMAPSYDFGVTDIPEDVWEEWEKLHKDEPFIKGGLIFALPKLKEVMAEAKVRALEKTGLEPLNQDVAKEPRFQTVALPGQPETHVETDLDQLAKLKKYNDEMLS
jgi:hypothetical protein